MINHSQSKSHQKFIVIILILMVLAACNLPTSQNPMSPRIIWATNDPNATITPTPFQPVPPTQMVLPTLSIGMPTLESTQVPTVDPSMNKNITNILILGSDKRQTADFRTDVIVLVSLNSKTNTVSLVSFPRDLYVTIPNLGPERINVAQEFGGFPMLADTFEYNFGIRPSNYILTNFQGFVSIIDSLGGIDINAAIGLTDTCKLPQASGGYCSVGPGQAHLDGQTALWYVRSRYSTSDFDRTRRAQEVLLGSFRALMSLNAIGRAPELYNLYKQNVETDLALGDFLSVAGMAPAVMSNPALIRQYAIGPAEVTSYVVPDTGAQVLIPNLDAVYNIVHQAVYGQ